jgi:Tol biopolymer transport system component
MSRRVAARFRFLAGAIGLASLALATSASAAFPGHNGKIAFTTTAGIETIRPDGSHRQRIAPNFYGPFFSATGHRILAYKGRNVSFYLMRADGTHRHRIPHTAWPSAVSASLSPSGKRIVFTRQRGRVGPNITRAVFTMRIDGTDLHRLTPFGSSAIDDCVFSPNGGRIACDRATPSGEGLLVMRANGTDQHVIAAMTGAEDFDPDFSPTGKKIAFEADFAPGTESESSRAVHVYAVWTDGTHLRDLAGGVLPKAHDPAFSPNGKSIVFERHGRESRRQRIATMNQDGSNLHILTPSRMNSESPDWGVRTR